MPIIPVPPPSAALFAFSEGLAWLREVEGRFENLELGETENGVRLPAPHGIDFVPLDLAPPPVHEVPVAWRFWVSNGKIPLGVIDVAPKHKHNPYSEYEFLAFREGPAIELLLRSYRQVEEFSFGKEFFLELVKVPAIGCTLLWLRTSSTASRWGRAQDFVLAIPPRNQGFPENPIPALIGFEIVSRECRRVQASPFVVALERGDTGGTEEPPPTATAS